MAIEVELPDGSIAEFPDGTPDAVITGVLRKQFAQNAPAPGRAPPPGRSPAAGYAPGEGPASPPRGAPPRMAPPPALAAPPRGMPPARPAAPAGPQMLPPVDVPPPAAAAPGAPPEPQQAPMRQFTAPANALAGDTPKAPDPYAEPDATTWIGRRAQDVMGKTDARYKGLPTAAEVLLKQGKLGPGSGLGSEQFAWLTGAHDKDMAKVYGRLFGDKFVRVEADANGAPMIVYKDGAGEARAYVNQPGLDMQDVVRGTVGAVPYLASATGVGAMFKAAPLVPRMLAQGFGAAGASVAQDVVGKAGGVTNPTAQEMQDKAGWSAAGGAGGEAIGAGLGYLARKFITEPRLFNQGRLTPQGEAAAQAAGLDVAQLTQELQQEFAKELARTGQSTVAGATLNTKPFGIPVTRGQISKDPQQLRIEGGMRHGIEGGHAKSMIDAFDRSQAGAVEGAALGGQEAKLSVARTIAPERVGNTPPGALGTEVRSAVQEARDTASKAASDAWEQAGPIAPTEQAKALLPDIIKSHIGSRYVDAKSARDGGLTPIAHAMLNDLAAFMEGKAATASTSPAQRFVDQSSFHNINEMRKRLGDMAHDAASGTNKSDGGAARAIYQGFNEWIDQTASQNLLTSGRASATEVAAMRTGIDRTREFYQVFGEASSKGVSTPGRKLIQTILDDTGNIAPEAIVSKLFTGAKSTPKDGSLEAINLIKTGLERYLPPERAASVLADIKLANWQRIVMDATGQLKSPKVMADNIEAFLRQQGAIARALHSPEEIRLISQFGRAMRDIAYKDPNPSGSGYTAAAYAGEFGKSILRIIGMTGGPMEKVITTILGWSGAKSLVGIPRAINATKQGAPTVRPNGAGVGADLAANIDTARKRSPAP